jgi:hypothetical protein
MFKVSLCCLKNNKGIPSILLLRPLLIKTTPSLTLNGNTLNSFNVSFS